MTPMGSSARTRRANRKPARWPLHIVLLIGCVLMLYPIAWMIGGSFKQESDIFSQLSPIPLTPAIHAYIDGWNSPGGSFGRFFLNSLIIAACCVVGNVFACSLAAYAFARLRFKLRRLWFSIMFLSIMLPMHAILIPQYIEFYRLGWINTFLPLIVPKFLATDAFFIFLMVQFIRSIPRELDEAARVDGCTFAGTFWWVILPLLRPAIITTVIFTFIWTYNDFFPQLLYLSTPQNQTVPVALANFVDSSSASGSSSYGSLLAMSTLSLVPTFIVFVVSQRRLVAGIATTGIRG
jgi:multiple sugar transport system permease protein